ncbi:hypothetical protein AB0L35_37505 [Streptomyces sp. NPDC052309]|uniref:hypothetical protein n=1 Tax=Streptomyces TaxID=1883 RepID=UPI001CB72F86|nr:hypothetical protein [Streptomyces griseicoloratus]
MTKLSLTTYVLAATACVKADRARSWAAFVDAHVLLLAMAATGMAQPTPPSSA